MGRDDGRNFISSPIAGDTLVVDLAQERRRRQPGPDEWWRTFITDPQDIHVGIVTLNSNPHSWGDIFVQ
jgi:hypothetical protein